MTRFTFSKNERLSSQKEIDHLFQDGKSISSPLFRLIWKETGVNDSAIQVMFSVPKKTFPKAVDRNRMKRLMRESYRLIKTELFQQIKPDHHYNLALLYTGKELSDFATIQKMLKNALDRWLNKINPDPPAT